jgi:SSS family transporter
MNQPKGRIFIYLFLFWLSLFTAVAYGQQPPTAYFNWRLASPLPNTNGLAGAYAGVSNGALLVAGGTNFPDGKRPWNGGVKTWYDTVYALEKENASWRVAGVLPHPMAYGVSLTYGNSVLCLGGGDAVRNYADVFLLTYRDGTVQRQALPSLPAPLSNACGVLWENQVYLAGGLQRPDGQASNIFWRLNLAAPAGKMQWEVLPSLPGPGRMLAMAGAVEGKIYVLGGVHLNASGNTLQRQYLKDAWAYDMHTGWKRLADLPHPLAAAPSPAYSAGQSHLLLLGGDDGKYADKIMQLQENHPGFSRDILSYNVLTDAWAVRGQLPAQPDDRQGNLPAPVTTSLVVWNNQLVLPAGEIKPAVRSNAVVLATPVQPGGKFGGLDWSVIALYFVAVAGISIFVSRKMGQTTGDFFLGGQKIPWWAAGLSIFGSKLSALTFIAIPAKAYATDWVYIINNVMIVAIAPIVTIFYLPYFRKLKLTSVYEYLQIRFNPKVKLLGSFTFVVFQLSRLGVVIYLPALVLSAVTGINIFICIFVTTVITTAYSVSGGIEAVVWTEVMQVFVLLGGALASFFFITWHSEGGLHSLVTEAWKNGKLRLANEGWSVSEPVLWVVATGAFLTNLVTYTSDQVVVQRYLTTPTEKEARRSIYTNALMVIPATLIFFGVGTALWFFFRHQPAALNPHGRVDDVFPWFISQQLPAGLSGLVIAGLFAATMSTISSSMNAIATVVTTDFYKLYKKQASDRECLRFAKLFTVFLGVAGCLISVYLVYLHNASIWDQYLKIIGLFGGCLAGMFMAGIFFPSINSNGVLIGFAGSCIILYFIQKSTQINFFLYPVFAVIDCVVIGYLASRLFPGKNKKAAAV